MNDVLLHIGSRKLLPVFIILSVIILLRGHNYPGGGFIGALVFSAGYILVAIGNGVNTARQKLKIPPGALMPFGLLFALLSGVTGWFLDEPFFTGEWFSVKLLGVIELKAGTPLLFDAGVFLSVAGMSLGIVFLLLENLENNLQE